MSGEIEMRVYEGEIVEDDFPYELDSYEDHENALITERQSEDVHRWNQCRIAASAVGRFQRGLVRQLAGAAGLSEQTIYDYARAWRLKQHELAELKAAIEAGEEESGQPETLMPTHYVEASYDDNPPEVLRMAEDGRWTTARTRNEVKDRRQKKAEAQQGKAEHVDESECPSCGATSEHWQRIPGEVSSEH